MMRIKILGTGKYLPGCIVTAEDLDCKLNLPKGWVAKKSGILQRHHAKSETASQMGACAAHEALTAANLVGEDIDCIIGASGTMEQAIPCNAVLIKEAMGLQATSIPVFDINATCLSFLIAFDTAACLISAGRYRRILIVSSDIASHALDWDHKESCILFGDGAAAVVVGAGEGKSGILTSRFETYSRGAHLAEVKGGGTAIHPREYSEETKKDFLFRMDGERLFRMSLEYAPTFMQFLMKDANTCFDEIDLVIPHQASLNGLRLLQRHLSIPNHKFLVRIQEYGNTMAASIPMMLDDAIRSHKINRGERIMLIGTAAGFSIGGMIIDF